MLDFGINPWWLALEALLLLGGLVLAAMLAADVLRQRRAPASTAAWLLALLLLPYVGVALYLLFGARKLARPKHRVARFTPAPALCDSQRKLSHPLALLLQGLGQAAPLQASRVCIHTRPEQALSELLSVLSRASKRVLVDMYDFNFDPSTQPIFDALNACAKQGLEVKVLIDDIGSNALRSLIVTELKLNGADVRRFKPVSKLMSVRIANLRNHRKIVVCDGALAWTGGRNLASQYLSPLERVGSWQDLSCTIEGTAAQTLEDIALSDWRFASGEKLPPSFDPHTPICSEAAAEALVQVVATGPDIREDAWYAALLSACFTAQRRLWLVTPYFVPDEALQNALTVAARRGIEVCLVVPAKSDNQLVDWVRKSYLRELHHCGVQVFFYHPRMLHAKCMLMDDTLASLGTSNLDARSLFLNYEVISVFYSHQQIGEIGGFIRQLMRDSKTGMPRSHWLRETLTAPLKLLAPLL